MVVWYFTDIRLKCTLQLTALICIHTWIRHGSGSETQAGVQNQNGFEANIKFMQMITKQDNNAIWWL